MNTDKKEFLAQEIIKTYGISEIDTKLNYQLDKLGKLNYLKLKLNENYKAELTELTLEINTKKSLIQVLTHAKYLLQNGEGTDE